VSHTIPHLATTKQAADALGVSDRTVRRLIEAGKLRTVRVKRRVFVSADEIRRFIHAGGAR